MEAITQEIRKLKLNLPQILSLLIDAILEVCIWARGTGKSRGRTALRIVNCMEGLPRSTGLLIADTRANLLLKIWPEIQMGLNQLGFVEGEDYYLHSKPPKSAGFDSPIRPLQKEDKHFLYWKNGSVMLFFGTDKAKNQGPSVDWQIVEEAKNCNFAKLSEVLPTNRGNLGVWGDHYLHHSLLIVTDRPDTANGRWVYNYEQRNNVELAEMILEAWEEIMYLRGELQEANGKEADYIRAEIAQYEKMIDTFRRKLVWVHLADTFDNIDTLGLDQLIQLRQTLTDSKFRMSVLNERHVQVDRSFYVGFNENKHGYNAFNYKYVDSYSQTSKGVKEYNYFCFTDTDSDRPLELAFDVNTLFNCCIIAQDFSDKGENRIVNSFYTEEDNGIEVLAQRIRNFYEPHRKKVIHLYYDHTHKQGKTATGGKVYYIAWKEALERAGFAVKLYYIGVSTRYGERYGFLQDYFNDRLINTPKFKINMATCRYVVVSMDNTETKITTYRDKVTGQPQEKFEKNKKSETDGITPPMEATHFSECVDVWATGKHFKKSKANQSEEAPFIYAT